MRFKAFCYIVLGLFFVIGCVAQEITADIRGTVYDPSGAVVSAANVQIINTDRNITERAVKTRADGTYNAPVLPLGRYQIRVDAAGFAPYVANDIVLNLNDRRVYDIKLKVGSAEQQVTVTESPGQVNLEDNTSAGLINGTQIRELSVLSRNFVQLVTLMRAFPRTWPPISSMLEPPTQPGCQTRSTSSSTAIVHRKTVS